MKKIKISVIIPTCNRIDYLKKCINSILKQDYGEYEIIIVDDSDNDETQKYVDTLKNNSIIYIHNKDRQDAGKNRNIAYGKATGDIVVFIDDDDYYTDCCYFGRIADIFRNESVDIVLSNSNILYEEDNRTIEYKLGLPDRMDAKVYLLGFMKKYKKPTSTLGFAARKRVLDESNFINMHMMNDTSIYMRSCINAGLIKYDNSVIGVYRVHKSNYSKSVKADFIIKNLEEKKRIYDEVKKSGEFNQKWLDTQLLITAVYFAHGGEANKKEIEKVESFMKKNASRKAYILFKLRLLKCRI